MNKVNRIRVLTSILVCCFLFTSIISRAFTPFDYLIASAIAKKESLPVKSDLADAQLFDEEEGEEKSEKDFDDGKLCKSQTNFFFIATTYESPGITQVNLIVDYCFKRHLGESAAEIPLYLSKRTLQL